MLSWDEVRALGQLGWTIGSHTLSHPILSQQSDDDLAASWLILGDG